MVKTPKQGGHAAVQRGSVNMRSLTEDVQHADKGQVVVSLAQRSVDQTHDP